MRQGVIISTVAHVAALLLAVLFTGANPFDSVATEAIAVEIISPGEIPSDQPQTDAPENPPSKESTLDFNFDLSLAKLLQKPEMPSSPPATKPAQQATQPRVREQRSAGQPPSSSATLQATPKPPPAAPQVAAKPTPAPPLPMAMPPPTAQEGATEADKAGETDQAINVADLFGMPLALPDGRLGGGFDAPAIETARIERSAGHAFRAHLKTCAALPAGISPSEKISLVVRVALKADGTLAGQPILIEASASPKGPILLQSLLRGLTQCQPYNMLPADKYREWKSLDMRFTPADMGQG
jgi:hypothetical protein